MSYKRSDTKAFARAMRASNRAQADRLRQYGAEELLELDDPIGEDARHLGIEQALQARSGRRTQPKELGDNPKRTQGRLHRLRPSKSDRDGEVL